MKKSKIMNLEENISDGDVDSEIEISKIKSKKIAVEEIPIEEPKPKNKKTDKQIEAWNKALKKREENRNQRKKEKEEAQRLEKEKLESKILLKAQRIKKAQSKVLGDDLEDDVKIIDKPKKIKKKVIIYKSESESSEEEEIIVKKSKPKKKQIEQAIEKHLPDNNHVINTPTYRKVIKFI